MREYAKVTPRLWTGTLGEAMRGDHALQALASYLLTCPHGNMLGLFRLPLAYVALDLGMDTQLASKCLDKLCSLGFIECERERVWIVDYWRVELSSEDMHQKDRRIGQVVKLLRAQISSPLVARFLERYPATKAATQGALDAPCDAPFLGARDGSRARAGADQEQEQDQEQDQDTRSARDFAAFWDAYPRRVGKKDALKAWAQTAKDRPTLAVLLSSLGVLRASAQWRRDGGRFIPHPGTWLRRGGWDDQPENGAEVVTVRRPVEAIGPDFAARQSTDGRAYIREATRLLALRLSGGAMTPAEHADLDGYLAMFDQPCNSTGLAWFTSRLQGDAA